MSRNPESIDVYIGGMIHVWRKTRGWSQSRLGAVLGVSYQQVQKYETGVSRVPASSLLRIAKALNFPVLAFLPRDPDDPWVLWREISC